MAADDSNSKLSGRMTLMRVHIIIGVQILFAVGYLSVQAQVPTPVRPDPYTDDLNIKTRSVELERLKRESAKRGKNDPIQTPTAKFVEIRQDFEKIQKLQNAIVSIYTRSKVIDYERLARNAGAFKSTLVHLKKRLFPKSIDAKDERVSMDKKSETMATAEINGAELPLPTEIETFIIELDNELSAFVGNPIFANPKFVDVKDNLKAEANLERLIKLSAALSELSARSIKK